jgi:hypothetical protein
MGRECIGLRMGEMRNVYKILVGNTEGKIQLGKA